MRINLGIRIYSIVALQKARIFMCGRRAFLYVVVGDFTKRHRKNSIKFSLRQAGPTSCVLQQLNTLRHEFERCFTKQTD